jgi:polyhydroxyalkanoate synthase subunit PhaC
MADSPAPIADSTASPVPDLKAGVRAILDGWGALLKPVAEANRDKVDPRDKRFAGPEWDHPVFDVMRQGYAIMADAMMSAADAVPGDAEQKARMAFAMRTLVEAMSPANSPLTNPVALDRALETNGASLVAGFQHLMTDLQRGQLTHTAPTAFELGVNIATTPGKVVYETPLFQLIQYAPATPTVAATPLVIFPPWINRFYILDLSPEKSFIRWAVAEGLTVFMVSWKSADASMADVVWDDYIAAQIEAIDTIRDLLDVKSVHAIGYCVAGTTLAATLAVLAATGKAKKVNVLHRTGRFQRGGGAAEFRR